MTLLIVTGFRWVVLSFSIVVVKDHSEEFLIRRFS
jgi:hypothetical protein